MHRAADLLSSSRQNLALTGAGISVESGIPDFRSSGGLWDRYPVHEYATLRAFRDDPKKVWKMLAEMNNVIRPAKPNPAHRGLARLEQVGLLQGIITQNIDNLHQEGGTKRVIEYHGNVQTLTCLACGLQFDAEQVANRIPPQCSCGQFLKPDVIFFGESIPLKALQESYELASTCHVLLVIGTSAQVTPAATIPASAKQAGASIVEINIEPTMLTDSVTDVFLQGKAGDVVPALVSRVEVFLQKG